jgi:predicted RNA binding protein YcfA (HicA-like mRNA interferase family)
MPLRPLSYRQVARRLRAAGFNPVATHGSHVKFLRETPHGSRAVIVPKHREIAIGTLRSILRQSGLSAAEFDVLGD